MSSQKGKKAMDRREEAAQYVWVMCGAGLLVSVSSRMLCAKASTTPWFTLYKALI